MGIGLSVNPPRVCTWLSAAFGSPQRADPLWMDPMVNWRATAAQWNRSGTIATCKPSGQLGDCLVSSKKSAVRCRLKSWFLPCQPPAVTGGESLGNRGLALIAHTFMLAEERRNICLGDLAEGYRDYLSSRATRGIWVLRAAGKNPDFSSRRSSE